MKIISKNFKLLAVFLTVLTFSAFSDDDDRTVLEDIQAVNGVVHVVDTVIRPGNTD